MILILGSPLHAGLSILYQTLGARGAKLVVFLSMDAFPTRVGMYLGATPEESSLLFTEEKESVSLSDIRALVMDGFYVTAESLTGLDLADIPYVQTETWAAFIALFELIGRKALVANNVNDREALATRWSTLRYLSGQGLPVPRALVTSDLSALQRFTASVGSVGYKAVGDAAEVLTQLDPGQDDRFERLAFCPVHFEEAPGGRVATLTVVREQVFVYCPEGDPPPDDLQQACLKAAVGLGLVLAELPLRCTERGWMVTGLRPFPSPDSLSDSVILEAVVALLEGA